MRIKIVRRESRTKTIWILYEKWRLWPWWQQAGNVDPFGVCVPFECASLAEAKAKARKLFAAESTDRTIDSTELDTDDPNDWRLQPDRAGWPPMPEPIPPHPEPPKPADACSLDNPDANGISATKCGQWCRFHPCFKFCPYCGKPLVQRLESEPPKPVVVPCDLAMHERSGQCRAHKCELDWATEQDGHWRITCRASGNAFRADEHGVIVAAANNAGLDSLVAMAWNISPQMCAKLPPFVIEEGHERPDFRCMHPVGHSGPCNWRREEFFTRREP